MGEVLIIGVAGGSGSGKTTLTDALLQRFNGKISILHHDDYYRSNDGLTYEERCRINYDCPTAFETEKMIEHLVSLKEGKEILCPTYDYTVHNRAKETVRILPNPVILVEGILILADEQLRNLMDIKVFVDADPDIRLARRVLRDTEKRGRSVRSVMDQWQETVKPMYEIYVEPSKKHADIIVPRGGRNEVARDLLIGRIEKHLQ